MKKRPDVEATIVLLCPECGEVLVTAACDYCGCKVDTSEFTIDVQPAEILELGKE